MVIRDLVGSSSQRRGSGHGRGTATDTRLRAVILAVLTFALLSGAPVFAAEPCGTFSIVAYDSTTGEVGVAVQSCVFGVGSRVAWVEGRVGAIATQAMSNESFGPNGLRMLAAGMSARETMDWLLARDTDRDHRQVGIIDAKGGAANWTGSDCLHWAGDSAGVGFSCQGNILVSAEVVCGMARVFGETAGQELARRLIAALDAAQAAGGDSRGRQSAAILIGRHHPEYSEYAQRYVDIRVEDHETPIAELRRLYEIYESQSLVQAHLRFAQWLEAEGDSAAAGGERDRVGEVLGRILDQGIEDAQMLNSLAWFTAVHDIYLEQALQAAQRAVEYEPEDSNILDTLAEVHFRLGDSAKAIEIESRALELSPDDAHLKKQLARFRGISH